MPRNVYRKSGSDIISFMKRKGNNLELQRKEIRALWRDGKGDLYIRFYGKKYRWKRVRYSKNKKVGLYVVI